MKVKYIGGHTSIELAGYGIIKHGEVVDVPEEIANSLVATGNFTLVTKESFPRVIEKTEHKGGEE